MRQLEGMIEGREAAIRVLQQEIDSIWEKVSILQEYGGEQSADRSLRLQDAADALTGAIARARDEIDLLRRAQIMLEE